MTKNRWAGLNEFLKYGPGHTEQCAGQSISEPAGRQFFHHSQRDFLRNSNLGKERIITDRETKALFIRQNEACNGQPIWSSKGRRLIPRYFFLMSGAFGDTQNGGDYRNWPDRRGHMNKWDGCSLLESNQGGMLGFQLHAAPSRMNNISFIEIHDCISASIFSKRFLNANRIKMVENHL